MCISFTGFESFTWKFILTGWWWEFKTYKKHFEHKTSPKTLQNGIITKGKGRFLSASEEPSSNGSHLYSNMCLIKLLTSTHVAAVASFCPTQPPLKKPVQHFNAYPMYTENLIFHLRYCWWLMHSVCAYFFFVIVLNNMCKTCILSRHHLVQGSHEIA